MSRSNSLGNSPTTASAGAAMAAAAAASSNSPPTPNVVNSPVGLGDTGGPPFAPPMPTPDTVHLAAFLCLATQQPDPAAFIPRYNIHHTFCTGGNFFQIHAASKDRSNGTIILAQHDETLYCAIRSNFSNKSPKDAWNRENEAERPLLHSRGDPNSGWYGEAKNVPLSLLVDHVHSGGKVVITGCDYGGVIAQLSLSRLLWSDDIKESSGVGHNYISMDPTTNQPMDLRGRAIAITFATPVLLENTVVWQQRSKCGVDVNLDALGFLLHAASAAASDDACCCVCSESTRWNDSDGGGD